MNALYPSRQLSPFVIINEHSVLISQWTWLYQALSDVSMNKIAFRIKFCADDWTLLVMYSYGTVHFDSFQHGIKNLKLNLKLKRQQRLKVVVLSLGLRGIYVIITKAFGLLKQSLFCNVQRDVSSLPSYSKLNSKHNHWNSHVLLCLLLIGSC